MGYGDVGCYGHPTILTPSKKLVHSDITFLIEHYFFVLCMVYTNHFDEVIVYILYTDIDYLARNGMKFTQFYSAYPICTPARSGLLTGLVYYSPYFQALPYMRTLKMWEREAW